MAVSGDGGWDCPAFGPEGAEVGLLCFAAEEVGTRVCGNPGECGVVMAAERRRVSRRAEEIVVGAGEAAGLYLAEEEYAAEEPPAAGHVFAPTVADSVFGTVAGCGVWLGEMGRCGLPAEAHP